MLHEWKTFDYKDTAPKDCITWVFQNFVPVAKIQGDKHYSIISDHLGTPILATDEQGNKVWERTLDIYGRVRKEEGEKGFCNMLYQGQYLDTETELVYNYKRYYSQETGAYISQDPIGLAGNNPTLYAYVHDPNSWVDPFGLRGLWKLTNEGSSKRRVIGKGKKGKKFVEDSYMIDNIKEYIKLADSDDLEDNNKTKTEQLSSEVIFEIIHNYPERKAWLVHNKHIPIDVLKLLCKDKKSDVRFTVAMKNKNDRYVFEILMNDPDFSIRMAVVRNKRIPIDLLKKMVNDKDDEISKEAMRILKLRDSAL